MLNVEKKENGQELEFVISGRLDTMTAPELEAHLKDRLEGISSLILDITGLSYISSAGLRVLLSTQKVMNKQGRMVIRGASPEVMEIFDVTGFSDILTIE